MKRSYGVVIGESIDILVERMNDVLTKGYVPMGGISLREDHVFMQAVYKEENTVDVVEKKDKKSK